MSGARRPPAPPAAPPVVAVAWVPLRPEELNIPLLNAEEQAERNIPANEYADFLTGLGDRAENFALKLIANTMLDTDDIEMSRAAKYYLELVVGSSVGIDVSVVRIYVRTPAIYRAAMQPIVSIATITELVDAGTRILDATLFTSTPVEVRGKFRIMHEASQEQFDPNQVKKCLNAAIYLYRRSDKIFIRPNDVSPKIFRTEGIPVLTKNLFNLCLSDLDPEVYPITLMEAWNIDILSPKLRNSLLLGFAGLRQLQFISKNTPDGCQDMPVRTGIAYTRAFYALVRRSGFNSSSRPDNFIEVVGSINQYCDTLIMAAFSPEKVRRAVNTRQLYCCPRIITPDLPQPIFVPENLQRVGMLIPTLENAPEFHVNQDLAQFNVQVDVELRGLTYEGHGDVVAVQIQRHAVQENYRPAVEVNLPRAVAADRDQVARDANLLENIRERRENDAADEGGDVSSEDSHDA